MELPPGAATGMAIGAQIAKPQPAPVVTIGVGTKVPARCRRHGDVGSSGAWDRAAQEKGVWDARSLAHTGHNGACRQALKRFGLVGAVALGLRWHGWGGQPGWDHVTCNMTKSHTRTRRRVGSKKDARPWPCPLQNGLRWGHFTGF